MKKSIIIISFIILSLLFSSSFVFAENAGNQVVDGIRNTVGGVENAAQDAANGVGGAVKNGANMIKDGAQNVGNGMSNATQDMGNSVNNGVNNAGDEIKNSADKTGNTMRNMGDGAFNATRTATEDNTNNGSQGWMNRDMWTWIIVGIITIAIIALIWFYASKNNR